MFEQIVFSLGTLPHILSTMPGPEDPRVAGLEAMKIDICVAIQRVMITILTVRAACAIGLIGLITVVSAVHLLTLARNESRNRKTSELSCPARSSPLSDSPATAEPPLAVYRSYSELEKEVQMKLFRTIGLIAVLLLGVPLVHAEDNSIQQWVKANQPGRQHKYLEQLVVRWDFVMADFQVPKGSSPIKSTGTVNAKMIEGGRFLEAAITQQTPGLPPLENHEVWGFDNIEKKYVSTRWSNVETQIMIFSGTVDGTGKTFSMETEFRVLSGERVRLKEITRIEGPARAVIDIYTVNKDGKEVKIAQIVGSRRMKADAAPKGE